MRYAKRAKGVYESDNAIKNNFGAYAQIHIGNGKKHKLKWFVQKEDYPQSKVWIVVRGTANPANAYTDLKYTKTKDKLSGVSLHKGFMDATYEIYPNIKKHLSKKSEIHISGHSLGGAAASILAMWLVNDGYNLAFCYTFGQPKVTNKKGANKYKDLPIIRVINQGDPVAYLPPKTALSSLQDGSFEHFGEEVILQNGADYVYLQGHDASKSSITDLWNKLDSRQVKAHYMDSYIKNIQEKLDLIKEIPWSQKTAFQMPVEFLPLAFNLRNYYVLE